MSAIASMAIKADATTDPPRRSLRVASIDSWSPSTVMDKSRCTKRASIALIAASWDSEAACSWVSILSNISTSATRVVARSEAAIFVPSVKPSRNRRCSACSSLLRPASFMYTFQDVDCSWPA